MNLEDCIKNLGGNYDEIMHRMLSEERVKKFLKMFCADQSFSELYDAMNNGNYELAFRAAHTLKGICANLSIVNLGNKAIDITEALRGNVNNGADALLPDVIDEYNKAIECINNLE